MSERHPIVAITGSSGAGTSTVQRTFEEVFRREGVTAAVIEGDSFHAHDRKTMREKLAACEVGSGCQLSHFGPEANLFGELENLFRTYAESGGGDALQVEVRQLQAVAEGREYVLGHRDHEQVQPQRAAAHRARIVDAARPVHRPGDGQDVDRAAVGQTDLGQGHADGAGEVAVADRMSAQRDAGLNAVAGHLADSGGDDDAGDGALGRALGAFDGVADGLGGLVHVDDGPALDAARLDVAGAGDADGAVGVAHALGLHDEAGDLGLAQIQSGDDWRTASAAGVDDIGLAYGHLSLS